MKKLLLPILLLHLAVVVNAATYFFSSVSGDDSRTATQAKSSSTPWRSITKLNSIMSTLLPGDKIMFKRGETFDGAIVISVSGSSTAPIIFGAYGTGDRPVINGFATLSGWSQVRSNVWEANFYPASGSTNMVTMNGKQQNIGRYPNADGPNRGYFFMTYASSNQVSSSQLSSSPNWTGGEVVMRTARWVTDRSPITNHNGNTITFKPTSGFNPYMGSGFYIQNHTNTLDQNGEWYYDNNRKKLQMYFTSNDPNGYTIKGSVTGTLIYMTYRSYLTFNNLAFRGSNENTFFIKYCNNITINNCDINYSGGNAIMANNTPYLNVINCAVNNTNNNAIYLQDRCANATVSGNSVKNTAIMNGMGQSDADTYQAVIVRGDNSLIQYNSIDTTGFNPLQFRGDNIYVKNNFINYFDFLKDDGAGIYNGLGAGDNTVYKGSYVINNIILNGIGATAGTSDSLVPQAAGIYLDDNSNHITVSGNTVANCAMAGINNHNGHELVITGNTLFNNKIQFQQVSDYISPNPIRNCAITNNILFAKTTAQLASNISTVYNDINQFGSFDNNYYCRPMDDNYVLSYSYNYNGNTVQKIDNLAGWKSKFGYDVNSKGSPIDVPMSVISSITGTNKYWNGTYNQNVTNVYGYSSFGDNSFTWTPNKLDAGTLQVSAGTYSDNNNIGLNLPVGSLTAGKAYVISFSLIGSTNDRSMDVYLRKHGWPYTGFSQSSKISITSNRKDYQIGVVATGSDDASCIVFSYNQANGPIWLDNVQLQEASVTMTNPDDYILFQYNRNKTTRTFNISGTYYDSKGVAYTGQVTLQPYTSIVLTKQTSITTLNATRTATQSINLSGNLVSATANVATTSATNLSWKVENQRSNTAFYEIERSSDANNFSTISKAELKTSADSAITYQFNDPAPMAGKNYYRIKQYDEKGVYAVSKTIAVNNISFKINPNPARDVIHVAFDMPITADDHVSKQIMIRNVAGSNSKLVTVASTDNVSKLDIDVSTLPQGTYVLSLVSDGQTFSRTFIKL